MNQVNTAMITGIKCNEKNISVIFTAKRKYNEQKHEILNEKTLFAQLKIRYKYLMEK